jgi:hypothetical protein
MYLEERVATPGIRALELGVECRKLAYMNTVSFHLTLFFLCVLFAMHYLCCIRFLSSSGHASFSITFLAISSHVSPHSKQWFHK